jgi:Flp pilus assembly protein TadD
MAKLFPTNVRTRKRRSSLFNFMAARIFLLGMAVLLAISQTPIHAQQDDVKRAAELSQAGKPHDAELIWRQLAHTHPTNADVHVGLGVSLAQQGKLQEAASEYRRALKLNPHLRGVSFNLGLAEFKQGHLAAASRPRAATAA